MYRAVEESFLESTTKLLNANRNARSIIQKIENINLEEISESRREKLEYNLEKATLELRIAIKNHNYMSSRLINFDDI